MIADLLSVWDRILTGSTRAIVAEAPRSPDLMAEHILKTHADLCDHGSEFCILRFLIDCSRRAGVDCKWLPPTKLDYIGIYEFSRYSTSFKRT